MASINTLDISPLTVLRSRVRLVWQLTKRDFQSRYTGSTLGVVWMFLQPLAMMTTLWLVFNYGLKAKAATEGVPYAAWFFSAMVAWNFWADALSSSNSALVDYAFLLKKVKFEAPLLPLVKVLSALFVHCIFLILLLLVLVLGGVYPEWSWLGLPVFALWGSLFALGLGMMTSAIHIFYRDIGQILGIILQLGFWGTPIVWDLHIVPERFHKYFKLNPISYMTEGYRHVLLYHEPFWKFNPFQAVYAWGVCIGMLVVGYLIFQRLRPHFGDVI